MQRVLAVDRAQYGDRSHEIPTLYYSLHREFGIPWGILSDVGGNIVGSRSNGIKIAIIHCIKGV
jgi:hypothetical protein